MWRKPGCDIIVVPPHRLPSDQILRGESQIWASLLSSGNTENSQSKGKLVRMPFVSFQVWSGELYNLDPKYYLQLWWTSNSLDQLNCSCCVRLWVTAVVVKLNWHLIFMPLSQFNSPFSALQHSVNGHSLSSFCQVVADVFSIFPASPSKSCEDRRGRGLCLKSHLICHLKRHHLKSNCHLKRHHLKFNCHLKNVIWAKQDHKLFNPISIFQSILWLMNY